MKVLYVKNGDSSFIRIDEDILTKNFNVIVIHLRNEGRYTYFFQLLKLILFLTLLLPFGFTAFTRFADWHTTIITFFCKLYRKKLVVVVGGYDASWFPEYHYGVYDRKTRGKWAKYALRNANLLLPNNSSLIENTNKYIPGISRRGGINFFVPDRKGEIQVVFNGYHTNFWIPNEDLRQSNLVIMTAFISNKRSFYMKGVDDFIAAAASMPDLRFKLIGSELFLIQKWYESLPGNLEVTPPLDRNKLLEEYQKARVFCLLSLSEGMPNALCEAMLCGCVPVVSDVNFNAELVRGSGFVVDKRDASSIRNAIRQAVDSHEDINILARNRIVENFPFKRREDELVSVLLNLESKSRLKINLKE
jgi:glycosyltransferase involved in cell wall biosynthesis